MHVLAYSNVDVSVEYLRLYDCEVIAAKNPDVVVAVAIATTRFPNLQTYVNLH